MVLLIALTQPDVRTKKIDIVSFDTAESAQLYFTNMRSFFYFKSEEGGGTFDVYRPKAQKDDKIDPILPFAIYSNWRANETYIRLDTVPDQAGWDRAEILFEQKLLYKIPFPEIWNESQYEFGKEIYKALDNEHSIRLVNNNGNKVDLDSAERQKAKQILRDYFKLLGKL